jgi:hypothetical protein
MFELINILILFFIGLIILQLILANNIVEGNKNRKDTNNNTPTPTPTPTPTSIANPNGIYSYSDSSNSTNNALILGQQNAGNIAYLKERLDQTNNIAPMLKSLSVEVDQLQTQMDGLVKAQADYSSQITGGMVPQISGLE